jgi:4-alpha-glucanotransferase
LVVARAGIPAQVALPAVTPAQRRRRTLRLRREDGTDTLLHFAPDDLPANVVTAADGRAVAQRVLMLPPLAAGIHALECDDGTGIECSVLVAPDRCFLPPDLRGGARRFGLSAHLYALRRRGDQGIGDFTTLALLSEATARAGGSVVGINPLHALFAGDRERASPYHPSDRRFLDPVYIDVERVPDFAAAPAARSLHAQHGERIACLAARKDVDYDGVWQVKRSILDACFAHFETRAHGDPVVAAFEGFVAAGGEALHRFALFEAIAATQARAPWDRWPEPLRRPDAAGIAEFTTRNARSIRRTLYLQWLADRQLAEAAGRARDGGLAFGLYRDLAIGAAPDGSEPWASPGAFALGVSIGAPPDPFSPTGQVWDLPPPNPDAMLASACARFRDLLAANMRHAGALRIDHVMGLSRLFWVPGGASAAAGAYVRYPFDALMAALALESARARCLVVGEDLGTVPEGLRERLADAAVLSYRVLWFEREGDDFVAPSQWPAQAAACVSTHDLPTIAGWWTGADIDEREALGLLTAAAAAAARVERQAAKDALASALRRAGIGLDATAPYDAAVAGAIHRFVGDSASALALLQADDLAGETIALNLPGTDRERANWRRRLAVDVDALWQTEVGVQAATDFARAQRARP